MPYLDQMYYASGEPIIHSIKLSPQTLDIEFEVKSTNIDDRYFAFHFRDTIKVHNIVIELFIMAFYIDNIANVYHSKVIRL